MPSALGQGVLSRDGWAVVDDTTMPRFEAEAASARAFKGKAPWVAEDTLVFADGKACDVDGEWCPVSNHSTDKYFFGCGFNYRGCLSDLAALTGPMAMPPLAAFGVWWSHYETYTQESIQTEVMSGFANYSLPLNVLQMDCGWHGNITANGCKGQSITNYSVAPLFQSGAKNCDLRCVLHPRHPTFQVLGVGCNHVLDPEQTGLNPIYMIDFARLQRLRLERRLVPRRGGLRGHGCQRGVAGQVRASPTLDACFTCFSGYANIVRWHQTTVNPTCLCPRIG